MAFTTDRVCTLADLGPGSFGGTTLAVLGHPIGHSISPAIHGAALAEMARADSRFAAWRYGRFDVAPEDLPGALDRLFAAGFQGLNLTVPHKTLAAGLVAEIDPEARPVGAVNTLLRTPRGWRGYNTDGHGLAMGIREDLSADLKGAPVILLGAGGAARGAAVECLRRHCASLWIGNRTPDRLSELLASLRPVAGSIPLHGFPLREPPAALPAEALVINATAAGLRPDDPAPVDLDRIPRPAGVYDMVYNPPVPALLRRAAELGLPCANGLSMLVHQGALALAIWTGAEIPVAVMSRAACFAVAASR